MDATLSAARALHIGSLILLNGIFVFLVFVARPAFARAAADASPTGAAIGERLTRLVWLSLAIAIVSGLLWLVFQAASMSGQPPVRVLSQPDVIATVLARTRFGQDWMWRFVGLGVLVAILCLGGRSRERWRIGRERASWILSTAALGMLAWAGHAGATPGAPGRIHLVSDTIHLLAAGAWLGGLIPLALFLAYARGAGAAYGLTLANGATRRFSTLGLVSVGALLLTGVVNTGFLAGNIGALVGTPYGRLLLTKVGLFVVMVGIAAVNRWRLTSRLSAASGSPGAPTAIGALRRNAFIEAAIGAGIVLIVGALGITPPGSHVEPWWPFTVRPSLEPLDEVPGARWQAAVSGAIAVIGLGLVLYGALRRRYRRLVLSLGAAASLIATWYLLNVLTVAANPTTFQFSPVPYTTTSIAHGSQAYAPNCAVCHGKEGRGDGPAADSLRVKPANLTDKHVFGHPLGDFFWWISHGTPNGVMPGFAAQLDERTRWDLINFVRARAAGVQTQNMGAIAIDAPAPEAPDFPFERTDGRQGTLAAARGRRPVLLVFFTLPGSAARLTELVQTRDAFMRMGLGLLAVATQRSEPFVASHRPDFVVRTSSDVPAAYALFARPRPPGVTDHIEFLVDRDGYIRARWRPDDFPDWRDAANLATVKDGIERLPPTPLVGSHEH